MKEDGRERSPKKHSAIRRPKSPSLNSLGTVIDEFVLELGTNVRSFTEMCGHSGVRMIRNQLPDQIPARVFDKVREGAVAAGATPEQFGRIESAIQAVVELRTPKEKIPGIYKDADMSRETGLPASRISKIRRGLGYRDTTYGADVKSAIQGRIEISKKRAAESAARKAEMASRPKVERVPKPPKPPRSERIPKPKRAERVLRESVPDNIGEEMERRRREAYEEYKAIIAKHLGQDK